MMVVTGTSDQVQKTKLRADAPAMIHVQKDKEKINVREKRVEDRQVLDFVTSLMPPLATSEPSRSLPLPPSSSAYA